MEGEGNAGFQRWLALQGAAAKEQLTHLPDSELWHGRLGPLGIHALSRRDFQRSGDNLYYIRAAGAGRGQLWMIDRRGRRRLLMDPQRLEADSAAASITAFAPSRDGRRIAVNIDHGGSEISRIRVIRANDGKALADTIERVWGDSPVVWMPDGSGFLYRQLRGTAGDGDSKDPLRGMPVRWHRMGTDAGEDLTVLAAADETESSAAFPLSPQDSPAIDLSPHGTWVLGQTPESRTQVRVCIAKSPGSVRADLPWNCLIHPEDEVRRALVHANTLYVLATRRASNGHILAVPLPGATADLQSAPEIFPSPPSAVVSGLAVAHDALYVVTTLGGIDQLYRVSFGGRITRAPMPFAGSIPRSGLLKHLSASPDHDGVIFTLEAWLEPPRLYLFDQEGLLDLQGKSRRIAAYEDLAALETVATSADGTPVPLSIVYRRDIRLDGRNRTIVTAYGGYGMISAPSFQPWMLEWVRAGGVWATAHVRGGGEFGEDWHRAGQGAHKARGVEDLVACAQELVKRGYTSPQRTALMGGSMGALLIGGAITRFPRDFSAAVIRAGLLNPARILQATNGANQISEIGDPHEPNEMQALRAMDPYEHIEPGMHYPAVLLLVGLNDHRVANWMSGKFAGRLQEAAGADARPVWIRVSSESGHFPGSAWEAAEEYADVFAFLDAQLPGGASTESVARLSGRD